MSAVAACSLSWAQSGLMKVFENTVRAFIDIQSAITCTCVETSPTLPFLAEVVSAAGLALTTHADASGRTSLAPVESPADHF